MRQQIVNDNGSVQNLDIPQNIKDIYRTVWEIKQKNVLQMAADRGPFIDQSQSLNIHIAQPKYGPLTSMHFMGWKKGLKTGMYYLRTKPAAAAIKFTVDQEKVKTYKKSRSLCVDFFDKVITICIENKDLVRNLCQ